MVIYNHCALYGNALPLQRYGKQAFTRALFFPFCQMPAEKGTDQLLFNKQAAYENQLKRFRIYTDTKCSGYFFARKTFVDEIQNLFFSDNLGRRNFQAFSSRRFGKQAFTRALFFPFCQMPAEKGYL